MARKPISKSTDKQLDTLRRYVDDFRSQNEDNRTELELDVQYYHGKQLSEEERRELNARKQPAIVINRLRVAVNGIVGVLQKARVEPKALPRTPHDDGAADVATQTLKYAVDVAKFRGTRGRCFRDKTITGTEAVIVEMDKRNNPQIKRIRWHELIWDPRSLEEDFSDADYLGFGKWMYTKDIKRRWPEADVDISGSTSLGLSELSDSVSDDRPLDSRWVDKKFGRAFVVELYYKNDKGVWHRCMFYANGILEEGESPYPDDHGEPCCPIIAQTLYVDNDNNRYGAVRDMRDLQDEINKRRSKLLYLVTANQVQVEDPNIVEANTEVARREASRPDGVLPLGYRKVPTTDMAAGQAQLLAESKAELERMGPNPAILGRQGADTSGRAAQIRIDAGMVELSIIYESHDEWEVRVYRQIWNNVKKWWTAPMFVRVTDDIEDPTFIGLNQPIMGQTQAVDPETGAPAFDPYTGEPAMVEDILGYENDVGEMDVDFMIENSPYYQNLMAEQLAIIVDTVGRNPIYAQQVPFDVLLEMTTFPRKREMIKKVRAKGAEQQQMQQQAMAHQKDLETMQTTADILETNSKTTKNLADAQKAGADTTLQAHAAMLEAQRIANDAMQAEQEAAAQSGAPAA